MGMHWDICSLYSRPQAAIAAHLLADTVDWLHIGPLGGEIVVCEWQL